jgi:hypothetical protein
MNNLRDVVLFVPNWRAIGKAEIGILCAVEAVYKTLDLSLLVFAVNTKYL